MSFELLRYINTREDQKYFLEELQMLSDSIYRIGLEDWENVINSKLNIEYAGIIKKEITDAGIDKKQYMRELIQAIKGMKIVKLTIAINPSQKLINKISVWIKMNLGAGIICDFEVDKNILGGVKIAFEGKYMDNSLLNAWEDTWKLKGKELLEKFAYV